MAIKASVQITITKVIDIYACYRYYKLQASSVAAPSKPTTNPPSGWSETEPAYVSGSTNTLYFVDCNIYSDMSYSFSEVSKSSSYEAAKDAWNKANKAQESVDNLEIGGRNLLKRSSLLGEQLVCNEITIMNDVTLKAYTSEGYHIVTPSTGNANNGCGFYFYDFETLGLHPGDIITLSADIKGSSDAHDPFLSIHFAGTNTEWYGTGSIGKSKYFCTTDDFKRISVSYKMPAKDKFTSNKMWLALHGNYQADLYIRNLKLERGNKATDWTPAPEDSIVKVDVEYYLSTSATSLAGGSWSTTAPTWVNGKYMWSRTVTIDGAGNKTYSPSQNGVCIAGAKGSTGATGATGAAGKGVSSIVEQYYKSTSATSLAGGSWSTTYPGWENGKYIWTRSLITYTDNTTTTTSAVCVTGAKGNTGATGKGVKSTAVTYLVSTSGTTAPTGTWLTDIPNVAAGQYLWTRTVITYTDNTTSTLYSVARQGANGSNGSNGKSIGSITNYYLASASASGVTASTSGWTTTVQSVSASKKYLWNYEVIKYSDGTTANTTSPCIIGAYGNTGATGSIGATGNGIKSITEHYAVAASNTTAPTSWSDTVPTMTITNKYLWNYETVTYTDGTTSDTAKRVIGVYGNTGATGKGVKSTAVTYQASSSGTTIPTGTWNTTIPTVSAGQYLWTRTIITYTDNTTSTSYSIGRNGSNGSAGKGIKSTAITYQAGASGTTAPTGTWVSSLPATTAINPYLWTRTVITYTDSTTSTSYSVGSTPEGVVVGGRNLAKKGSIKKYGTAGNTTVTDSSYATNGSFTFSRKAVTNEGPMIDNGIPLVKGTSYVTSFKIKFDSKQVSTFFVFNGHNHVNTKVYIDDTYKGTFNANMSFPTDLAEHKVTLYYTADANSSLPTTDTGTTHTILQPAKSTAIAYTATVTGFKTEIGNKATDWTPAPEDQVTKGDVVNQINSELKIEGNSISLTTGHFTITSENLTLDAKGNAKFSGVITASSGEFTKGFFVDIPTEIGWNSTWRIKMGNTSCYIGWYSASIDAGDDCDSLISSISMKGGTLGLTAGDTLSLTTIGDNLVIKALSSTSLIEVNSTGALTLQSDGVMTFKTDGELDIWAGTVVLKNASLQANYAITTPYIALYSATPFIDFYYNKDGRYIARIIADSNSILTFSVKHDVRIVGVNGQGYIMHGDDGTTHTYACKWANDGLLHFKVDQSWVGTVSDARLKTDIKNIEDIYLDAVGKTDIMQYRMNVVPYNDDINFGVIAQDLRQAFKDSDLPLTGYKLMGVFKQSDTDDTDYYSVNYEQFMMARIAYDEREIKKLKQQIAELQKKLSM